MHYYQHHIGDFIRDTSRLSDTHLAAYIRMIWMYYESEQPLPDNAKVIGLKVGADAEVVSLILEAFFKRDGDVWRHTRCEKEIAEYHQIRERNNTNGRKGGRPKKTHSEPTNNPVGFQSVSSGNPVATHTEPSNNPDETLTINHKPITINTATNVAEADASMVDQLTKKELWDAGKSLLERSGVAKAQCGSFVGKLVKDYGEQIVVEAVRSAVVTQPVDPSEYLKAICMRSSGKRKGSGTSRHMGFETIDYTQGINDDGSF